MSPGRRLVVDGLIIGLVTVLLLVAVEGVARLIWWRLEGRAFALRSERGEEYLRNDAINFMKRPDGVYGYTLRPGFDRGSMATNAEGFAQRDPVGESRRPDTLRVVAMGESTTQGHNTDIGNYPVYLRAALERGTSGYQAVEMINAGVAGWVSDQLALRAERQLAAYRPDLVLLYAGWNDFQSYDPFAPPPARSLFEDMYGVLPPGDRLGLRSVQLLSAAVASAQVRVVRAIGSRGARPGPSPPAAVYRFYLANLDRIVAAYRQRNPGVRIAICTLVARWPMAPPDDTSRPEWMTIRGLDQREAADSLGRLNDLIRSYSRSRALVLIDAAAEFVQVDRRALMWDFMHMHAQGYELLAQVMYRGLVQGGVVAGAADPRLARLMAQYRLRAAAASP